MCLFLGVCFCKEHMLLVTETSPRLVITRLHPLKLHSVITAVRDECRFRSFSGQRIAAFCELLWGCLLLITSHCWLQQLSSLKNAAASLIHPLHPEICFHLFPHIPIHTYTSQVYTQVHEHVLEKSKSNLTPCILID